MVFNFVTKESAMIVMKSDEFSTEIIISFQHRSKILVATHFKMMAKEKQF